MTTSISIDMPRHPGAARSKQQREAVSQTDKNEKAGTSRGAQKMSRFNEEFEAIAASAETATAPTSSAERGSKRTADAEVIEVPQVRQDAEGVINIEMIVQQQNDVLMPAVMAVVPEDDLITVPAAMPAPAKCVVDVPSRVLNVRPILEDAIQLPAGPLEADAIVPLDPPNTIESIDSFRQVAGPRIDRGVIATHGNSKSPFEMRSMRTHWAASGPAQAFANDLSALAPVSLPRIYAKADSIGSSETPIIAEKVESGLDNKFAEARPSLADVGQHQTGDHPGSPHDDPPAFGKPSPEKPLIEPNVQTSGTPTAQELMTTSFGSMTSTISNETPVATLEPTRATQPPPEVLHARPEIVRNMEVVIDSGGHGSLGLQMSLNSKGLDLRVETSNADTAHLLNGDVDGLQARLLRSGLDVSSVNVHVTNDPTMSLPGSQPSNDERRGPWQQSSEANQSTSSGGGSGFHGGGEEAGAWKGRPNSQRPMSIVRQETTSRVTPTGSRTLFV